MEMVSASVTLLLLGIAILVALELDYARRNRPAQDRLYLVLHLGGWTFVTLGALVFFSITAGPFAIVLLFLFPVVAVLVRVQHLATQRRILLSMVAIAAERGLPLAAALDAFAREYRGAARSWAQQLAARLNAGESLPEAIQANRGVMPEFAEVYARTGQDAGAMGQALREAVAAQAWERSLWQSLAGRILYLLAVLMVGLGVGTFLMIKIVPAYQSIFNDFGVPLPALTRMIVVVGNALANGLWCVVAAVFLGLLAAAGALLSHERGWPLRLPGLERLFMRRHAAVVLHNLALATEHQLPIASALRSMAAVYPLDSLRRRLSSVAGATEMGGEWCEGLRAHHLIGQADAAVLRSAERVGNLPWALRDTADRGLKRLAYRAQALVQILFPWLILCLGVGVLLFVVGMFIPLVNLIQGLT